MESYTISIGRTVYHVKELVICGKSFFEILCQDTDSPFRENMAFCGLFDSEKEANSYIDKHLN